MLEKDALTERLARGATQREIAAEFQCSQTTVRYWMSRYGLCTPPRKHKLAAAGQMATPGYVPGPPTERFGVAEGGRNTNSIGASTEAQVLAVLTRAGYHCYVPFGVGKADLVIETESGFRSVQCKTGRFAQGYIEFNTSSKGRAYHGVVDLFAVCAAGAHDVYLVPVGDVGRKAARLRVSPTRNGQASGCRFAESYLVR